MNEQTFGANVQTHVELAIAKNKKVIEEASELAKKAGVGVWVNVRFTKADIIITAEPNVRVPLGEIRCPDFSKFKERDING